MNLTRSIWKIAISKATNVIVGVSGLVIGIYSIWFYQPRPILVLDKISDSKVLDVYAALGKLDIVYAGESLKANNQELRLVVVRFSNEGRTDITKDSFDTDDPLGIRIASGILLEPPTVSSSSSYLRTNARLVQSAPDTVLIRPVVVDSAEWIELNMLIAVPAGRVPSISPIGKIAGVKQIRVTSSAEERLNKPLWSRLVGADAFWIQIARIPIYLFGFILFALFVAVAGMIGYVVFVYPFEQVNDWRLNRKRKGMVDTYRKTREFRPTDHAVVDEYLEMGSAVIPFIRRYMDGVAGHNADVDERRSLIEHLKTKFDADTLKRTTKLRKPRRFPQFRKAKEREIQVVNNGMVTIDSDLERAVNDFDRFLRAHGEVAAEERVPSTIDVDEEEVVVDARESRARIVRTNFGSPFDE